MSTVLVVQHEDDCPPALLGEWLGETGVELDVRRPYVGEPLPVDLARHDGLLVLGGPMGANDDVEHAWLAPTRALVRDAVDHDVPALGVCLGHQLMAVALGGAIERNPRGTQRGLIEVGWLPEAAVDELLAPVATPRRCLQWNDDVVTELPPDAVLLAATPAGEVQAVRFAARAWGLQSHPEVDGAVVASWAASDWGAGPAALVEAVRGARGELERSWRPLATSFASVVHGVGG